MCVTREGTGKNIPIDSKVKYHYSAFLMDGTKLDSSHDIGVPMVGEVGSGKLQNCIDEAIRKMKVG